MVSRMVPQAGLYFYTIRKWKHSEEAQIQSFNKTELRVPYRHNQYSLLTELFYSPAAVRQTCSKVPKNAAVAMLVAMFISSAILGMLLDGFLSCLGSVSINTIVPCSCQIF